MQHKPTITLGELKELLKKCASKDEHTGDVPNPRWGYGKLDYDAVTRLMKSVRRDGS